MQIPLKQLMLCVTLFASAGRGHAYAKQRGIVDKDSKIAIVDAAVASALIDAKGKILKGQISQAEQTLLKIKSSLTDPQYRVVWHVLFAQLMEMKENWSEAGLQGSTALREHATALAGNSETKAGQIQWNLSLRDVFFLTVDNFTRAGLVLSAHMEFQRSKDELGRLMLSAEEELILKKLADELRRIDRAGDAGEIEKIVFRHYPFLNTSLMASLSQETLCRLDDEFENIPEKKLRSSILIQRLGARDDLKNYAYSLVGWNSVESLATMNPDSLSPQTRSEMLDLVEWMHSVREYVLAFPITEKLMASKTFEPPFTKDRLMMLHARNLNGVHRPVEAAELYRSLLQQFPIGETGKTARTRYVMSLHFAKRYKDVDRQAALLSGTMRPREVAWRKFWARYLAKEYGEVVSAPQSKMGKEQRARVQYWQARAYEGNGKSREALEAFKKIPIEDGSLQYSLFARWRLTPPRSVGAVVPRGTITLASKNLTAVGSGDTSVFSTPPRFRPEWAPYQKLLENGFGGLLRGQLRMSMQSNPTSAAEIARLLVEAGDAHAGVQYANGQMRISGRTPVGRDSQWKGYLAKNETALKLLYPLAYRGWVAQAAEINKISPWLVLSIMRAESLFQPQVVSNVGARGLMQIMPVSGARIAELSGYPEFEPAHLDRPEVSISFGAWYLSRLIRYYKGNLPLAIAAYNAGPVAIDRWLKRNPNLSLDEFLEDIPFDQTRKYVATVLTNMEIYSRIYSQGSRGIEVDLRAELPTPRNDMEIF